jgi:hypothetical protein
MQNCKTFKIGEYALGGIIRVKKTRLTVTIEALEYNNPAQIVESATMLIFDIPAIETWLNFLTTFYYAEKIMQFIKK